MKKILVTVDASKFSEKAIPAALDLASGEGAELRIAMVSVPLNPSPDFWAEAFEENHLRYLAMTLEAVEPRVPAGVSVTTVLLKGEIPSAVLTEAEEWGADVIVMSTHGQGGLARAWIGSVADAVLHESPVPVLLVRPGDDPEEEAWVRPTNIALALDGKAFAEAGLNPAVDLASLFDARLTIVNVVTLLTDFGVYFPDTIELNAQYVERTEREAHEYLGVVGKRLEDQGVQVETEVVLSATPGQGVLDTVDRTGAELIVVASHTRKGLSRVVLGSVGDKIVRGSDRPVLVVPGSKVAASD